MSEKWKNIKGYEGKYRVSNLGRIYNVKANKIVRQEQTKKGYMRVTLSMNGNVKKFRVHRLVAEAFIPNPENKPQVNHINGFKADNMASNLEWCTNSENMIHAVKTGLHACSKTIVQFDTNGRFIKKWKSCMDIERAMNISHVTISRACRRGNNHMTKGYVWLYEEDVVLADIEASCAAYVAIFSNLF